MMSEYARYCRSSDFLLTDPLEQNLHKRLWHMIRFLFRVEGEVGGRCRDYKQRDTTRVKGFKVPFLGGFLCLRRE